MGWTKCDSIGYCVDKEDVNAELEMDNRRGKNPRPTRGPKPSKTKKPKSTKGPKPTKAPKIKPTKAPKCSAQDSEEECESVGCEWKTGNPPNNIDNDYLEEEFAVNLGV